MSFFSQGHIKQIEGEYSSILDKQKDLVVFFTSYDFSNEKASEYARHGYLRRIYTIVHCIESVFQKLPPDITEIPSREITRDATIALQAFVLNIFGIADNLAWIWATERNLKTPGGAPISRGHIGLRSKNETIRKSFSNLIIQNPHPAIKTRYGRGFTCSPAHISRSVMVSSL